jgi:hypothetical protein
LSNQVVANTLINLRPGVALDPIAIGMPRSEVHHLLGQPDSGADDDEYRQRGVEIAYTDDKVATVSAFGGVIDYDTGYGRFPLVGPHGLTWGATSDDVRAVFGEPQEIGSTNSIPSWWILYAAGASFEFGTATKRLLHVTVSAPDPTAGRQ